MLKRLANEYSVLAGEFHRSAALEHPHTSYRCRGASGMMERWEFNAATASGVRNATRQILLNQLKGIALASVSWPGPEPQVL